MAGLLKIIKNRWGAFSLKDKVLLFATLAILMVFLTFFILAASGEIGLLIVKSGSMQPYMSPGSLLVFRSAKIADIRVGEVIVFREDPSSNLLITHRAIDKIFENGNHYIKTKGDTNHHIDTMLVGENQLVGKSAYIIPGAGYVLNYAKTPVGLLTLNLMLAFFTLLSVIDRVKARERVRYDAETTIAILAGSSAGNEG